MKRKLLSLLVLLLTAATGVWAQTDQETPLTLEAKTDGTIKIYYPKEGMQYTLNGGDKTTILPNEDDEWELDVAIGDKVAFYGKGTDIDRYFGTWIAGGTAECYVYGNVMSLVDETGFATNTTLTADHTFTNLFSDNDLLYNHDSKELKLPATTLTEICYSAMLAGCTNLTKAPALPATTLTLNCYSSMFAGCTSLTTAPELPATTLADGCYSGMFNYCEALITAPAVLPAETMKENCYQMMFAGCNNLTSAPTLPAMTLADGCYESMFWECASLTIAPELPATTLVGSCYNGMFEDCTSLTTAPVLPATTLAPYCYFNMFDGCSQLNSVTCLATNLSAEESTYIWLKGVAATGTFIKNANTTWTAGVSGIPSDWTVINYVDEAADNSTWLTADDGESEIVLLKRALSATGWNTFCVPFEYSPIPTGWTVKKLTGSALDAGALTLTFADETTKIEAGKPYMIKVPDDIEMLLFDEGVTINKTPAPTETTYADFVPVMTPTELTADDKTKLFLTGGNKLTWPNTTASMKSFRGYFQLKGDAATAHSFAMNFDGDVTGISEMERMRNGENEKFFDLQGRRVAQPTKGLYINNGRKVIIK